MRFFLRGIAETATKGRDVFQEILALRNELEPRLLGLGKRAPNARRAMEMLYRKPILTAADWVGDLKISKPTANALIRDLMQLGILKEITGQERWRAYAFDRYLGLFVR